MTEQEIIELIAEFEKTDLLDAEKYKTENPPKWAQFCIWYNCKNKKYAQETIVAVLKLLDFVVE